MIDYTNRGYKRKKVAGKIRNFVWSAICVAIAVVILIYVVKWVTPWFRNLGNTVM